MKTFWNIAEKFFLAVAIVALAFALAGCQGGPTAFERIIYRVQTNIVPHVIVQTNTQNFTSWVPTVVTKPFFFIVTNDAGAPYLGTNWNFHTNWEAYSEVRHSIVTTTNLEERHEYTLKPEAQEGFNTVGSVVNTFVPGLGGLIGIALTGAAGIWARLRSRKANEALLQTVQTGREIIKDISGNPDVDRAYKDWMEKHQKELGVFTLVSGLVEKLRDKPAAKEDAKEILHEAGVPPTPPSV